MPIIHATTAPTHELEATRFWQLAAPSIGSREASVWRVEVSPGAEPVPHTLSREEILVVLDGTARVTLGRTTDEVGAGDAVVVPADTQFSLAAAGNRSVVALAYLPVGGQATVDGRRFTPPWAL
jgi:quercetin dioxygenase-like cupin family protein